jgi:hypothetical protein
MMLAYYHQEYEPCALVNKKFNREDCCDQYCGADTNKCNRPIYPNELQEFSAEFGLTATGRGPHIEVLRNEIDQERPVELLLFRYDQSGNETGSHIVVACGYAEVDGRWKVSIHDPAANHGYIVVDLDDLKSTYINGQWKLTYTISSVT